MFTTPDLGYDLHVAGVSDFQPVDGHVTGAHLATDVLGRSLLVYADGNRRIGLMGKPEALRAVLNAWLAVLDEQP